MDAIAFMRKLGRSIGYLYAGLSQFPIFISLYFSPFYIFPLLMIMRLLKEFYYTSSKLFYEGSSCSPVAFPSCSEN